MKACIIRSILFITSISPLILIVAVLIFSAIAIVIIWMETSNAWMPLIFTLAFLGGMIIIFIYIISISSTKIKKNKNKLPVGFVFVCIAIWRLKYGRSPRIVHSILSSFFSQYLFLCSLILIILFISTKIINSPFKALKGAS